MQDTTYAAYEAAHQATAAMAPDLAAQTAGYAAADLGFFAATQEAAAASVVSAGELLKSGGEAAMSGAEVALLAAEAAGATAAAVVTGIALPAILGTIGVVGLGGAAYYGWRNKGFTLAEMRDRIAQARNQAQAPGTWPEWNGYTDEAIWKDDDLLDAATRPEPSADELELGEIDWDELELELVDDEAQAWLTRKLEQPLEYAE